MKVRNTTLNEMSVSGHYHFPVPPEGFEPHKATPEKLRQYGLPHRPDPIKFPAASKAWVHAMKRIKRFVTPNLRERTDKIHGVRPKINRGKHLATAEGLIFDNTSKMATWSGLQSPNFSPYSLIWANWVVPLAEKPEGEKTASDCSIWIGLGDGASLFQAGTNAAVSSGGSVKYDAWFEWFPGLGLVLDGSAHVQSFPVKPGETISVSLEHEGAGGIVSMLNVTTGLAITPIFVTTPMKNFWGDPIAPLVFPTDQALWIMERPSTFDIKGRTATPIPLANFGQMVMTLAGAVGTNAAGATRGKGNEIAVGESDQGELLDMVADDGSFLCIASEVPGLTFSYQGGG